MCSCICMLKQTLIYFFIDLTQNHKKLKKIQFEFFVKKSLKNHNSKNICTRTFCLAPNKRALSNLLTLLILSSAAISQKPELSHEKMKTMVFLNMSKSRGLTSTFIPINHSNSKRRPRCRERRLTTRKPN